ncbi:N-acetylmuramoyl-L-alanine amidase [Sporomusaceae bacterium BoRhaA]|uniref:N-acetylmuramoyl-L-alanine amidase family protein n=1 Tax=Pelorhabdus rhamnosifermentans TaxID=2772457 RepID=UPI001C06147E|nr:N-acetylmuramoyl-L-alanine amidase [Pelorhabdus rhamnosifermentans]MBU2701953.1 N-acetylmuramoyl-L-alanine amidase [Pelorhabdus rhamnosifermentans]
MTSNKIMIAVLVLMLSFNFLLPLTVSYAAPLDNLAQTLTASTVSSSSSGSSGGGLINTIFSFLFDKILGPLLHLGSSSTTGSVPTTISPSGSSANPPSNVDSGGLKGKVIVVDPGHGGSNPGAVGNNVRESDINLAVALKLQDQLTQAGAKVIMTRSSDHTVAPEGSTLGQELAARVEQAESNHADLFISLHSNENSDNSIQGAMTFYNSAQSSPVALIVQNALISATGANDKGTSQANFYVIRSTSMPSILVEMGFVSNGQEAVKLNSSDYQNKIALGIRKGIVQYFSQK